MCLFLCREDLQWTMPRRPVHARAGDVLHPPRELAVQLSELLVLPTLWPDFSPRDLYGAVAEYQRRSRRFGGL